MTFMMPFLKRSELRLGMAAILMLSAIVLVSAE